MGAGKYKKFDLHEMRSCRHIRIERVQEEDAAEFSYKVDLYNDAGDRFSPISLYGFKVPVVDALTDWCMDHLDLDDWTFLVRSGNQTYDFEFANESIATAFKLRWQSVVFENPFG